MSIRSAAARLLRETASRLDPAPHRTVSVALVADVGTVISRMAHRDHVHVDYNQGGVISPGLA